MSRFVVLIIANANPNEQLLAREKFGPLTHLCAITVSSNPKHGLASLQSYCPIPCELLHWIESGTRTEDLERTLHIRFQAQRLRPNNCFWFWLTPGDVEFIRSITPDNLSRITGIIKRQLATDPERFIASAKLPDFINEQLELCNQLLKS